MSYQTIFKSSENSTLTKLKPYAESASENTIMKNLLNTILRKHNGRWMIILLFRKIIYTPLRGKLNLEVNKHIFIIYTDPNATDFDKNHTRDEILLLAHAPILMNQGMVKTGKLAPFLPHPYYIYQILTRMVKVKSLRPRHTYVIMIFPPENLSQMRTLKLHVNLCNNHHRGEVTSLQRLRSTIQRLKLFCKMDSVILEEVNTCCALILILTNDK